MKGEGCVVSEVQGGVGYLGRLIISAEPLSMSILWILLAQPIGLLCK